MARRPRDADSSQFPYKGDVDPTSTGLIVLIKDGESTAWDRFVTLYAPLIRHWCEKPGGGTLTRQDRQDIMQEVLTKVSKAIGEFDENRPGRSLRAWLRSITQNTIADHLEFVARRLPVSRLMSDTGHFKYDKQAESPIEEESEEEESEKIILLEQVLEIVRPEFSDRDWDIMQLFVFAEKTSSEVGQDMNMKADTVRRLKNRVLARIRREYEALGLDDEMPTAQ